jgi:hypothetical protein
MWGNIGGTAALLALVVGCSRHEGQGDDADAEPPPSGSFTVLSYNVAGLPQEISTVNPKEHLPLISPLLDDYDVVLTQEDFDWWRPALDGFDFVNYHDRVRADVTHEHQTAQYPGPEAAGVDLAARPELAIGDGLGVLSRFPFTDEQRVPWRGCFGGLDTSDGGAADCAAAKGFAVVRMTLADGVEVDVYTLHAEAGGTPKDQALQVDDFAELAEFINSYSDGRAVIMGGDTNLHTDSDHPDASGGADTEVWTDFLAAASLTDACAATDCPDTDSIDKIAFRSAGGVTLDATDHEMPRERFRDPAGDDLSDHPPLVVSFAWSGGD